MAIRYFDLNGATAGFGTLTGAWDTTSAFWSTSSAGTAVPTAYMFTNADSANFGFAGTTATAGTATIPASLTVNLGGITTANLAGLQTITAGAGGSIAFSGATATIDVGNAGGLTIASVISGSAALTRQGAGTLTLSGASGYLGTVSLTAGNTVISVDGGASGFFRNAVSVTGSTLIANNYNMFGVSTNASAASLTLNAGGRITNNGNYLTTLGALTMNGGAVDAIAPQPINFWPGGAAYIIRGPVTATANSEITAGGFNISMGSDVAPSIGTFTVSAGKTLGVAAVITNRPNTLFNALQTLSVTSDGAGVLILAGANTFTGGFTQSSGTLRLGTSSNSGPLTQGPVGTGTLTVTGGAVSSDSTAARSIANALSLSGTVTLGDATNTGLLTFSGATTIAGTTSLTIPANYVLMQGVFGGTGAFTLSSGELDLEGATGTKSGGTTVSGGTLFLGFGKTLPDQLGSDALTITSGSVSFCGSSNSTIANTITGSGGTLVARPRNAVVTFSNASAYTGIFRIFAGTSDGAGTTTQGMTLSAFPTSATDFSFINQNTGTAVTQTFKYTGTANVGAVTPLTSTISMVPTVANSVGVWQHSPSNGTATMSIAGAVASNTAVAHTIRFTNDSSGLLSFSGGIDQRGAGVMAVSKTGTGPVSVSGTGTYTGTVTVSAGTFNADSLTALGSDAAGVGGGTVSSGATLSLNVALNYSTRNWNLTGTGVGGTTGALVVNYAGNVKIGAITLTGPTLIRGTADGGNLTSNISGTQNLSLGTDLNKTFIVSGIIQTGTGTLTIQDEGTTALAGQNTFSGTVRLSRGTVRLDAAQSGLSSGPLGSNNSAASLIFAGASSVDAILEYTATNTFDYSPRFEGVASTRSNVNTRIPTGLSVTWAGNWATNGSVFAYDVGKLGGGTLRMTSTGNTRLGTTYIYDGVVSFVSGSLSDVSFNGPNAILKWEPGNTQDKSASLLFPNNYGQFDTNGNNVTFATSVWGIGYARYLTKLGLGALTLTASSLGGGTTTITAGSIRAGQVDAFGTSSGVVIGANGKLETLTAGGQNGKLTVAGLTNSAGGTIKIGG